MSMWNCLLIVLQVAVEGSLNIFRQAEKAGIRHFAFVSSIVTFPAPFLFGADVPDMMLKDDGE